LLGSAGYDLVIDETEAEASGDIAPYILTAGGEGA
jgi:hypothetical protein